MPYSPIDQIVCSNGESDMGYWGTLMAVRGDQTPVALEDFDVSVGCHQSAVRGDGWRVHEVPGNVLGDGPGHLLALVGVSSGPVIAAYIADSDHGQVVAAFPSVDRWGVWLDRDTAYALERDYHLIGCDRRRPGMLTPSPAN
jgi:hypothetical protein